MSHGILIKVTHTGQAGISIFLSDINDAVSDLDSFRKPGPIYVPISQSVCIVYTKNVAISFETGAIRKFIGTGDVTAEFCLGDEFKAAIFPEIQDEGLLIDPSTEIINFTGAGVTATQTVPGEVQVNIPGGGGGDHAALINLSWLLSGHTGAPGSLAAFNNLGASSLLIGGAHGDTTYFDGNNWVTLAPGVAGQLLQTNGVGANPSWVAPSSTRTDFGVLAVDPVGPANNGDIYYNSAIDMEMRYDSVRGKWLSIEAQEFTFGRNGNTAPGQFYRTVNGRVMSAALGWRAVENGTVVAIEYTRRDVDAATFQVTASGAQIGTLASAATNGGNKNFNADFNANNILAVRNMVGSGITTDVVGWIRVKWRA